MTKANALRADVARAYRRLPIRWRLAGGSAALTMIILMGFATIVGVLTSRRLEDDFASKVRRTATELAERVEWRFSPSTGRSVLAGPQVKEFAAAQNALLNVIPPRPGYPRGERFPRAPFPDTLPEYRGFQVETRPIATRNVDTGELTGNALLVYGERLSEIKPVIRRVRFLLFLGVLGGSGLALLAGLALARRAMAPIAELTEAARRIERTRDTSVQIPRPEARDEVAELAATLEGMLGSLDRSRSETEAALTRQREFVADASHELRTPLTSVLANLELLEEILEGEAREAVTSALRSSRRMRRLVADLLLLARADAGRAARHEPVDVSQVVAEVAGELEPVAGDHELRVDGASGAVIDGARDELHRLVLNLMENALRHTDPGTAVEATVAREGDTVIVAVEDDGPGIPPELAEKVFERFFRGASDRGGSSGLGLAIVRAVTDSHGGTVTLEPPLDGRGARFVVRFPASVGARSEAAPASA